MMLALTLDQRATLARYHAFLFCHCTKSEPTNRQRSASIDAGLGYVQDRIAKNPKLLGDMTAAEFIAFGRKRAKRMGVALWRATDVLAEVESLDAPV